MLIEVDRGINWNKCKPAYSEAELFTILEGARQQWTREVLFLLCKPGVTLSDELLVKMLTDTFGCPVTTKPYTKDIFRDLRTTFKTWSLDKVTPWARQHHSHMSMAKRDKSKIVNMVNVRPQTLAQFRHMRGKKLVTQAVFSPPSDAKNENWRSLLRIVY